MRDSASVPKFIMAVSQSRIERLQHRLLRCSLFNFFVVTLSGLLLRSMGVMVNIPYSYRNILHGHSHFAFSGWLTPGLLWMVMRTFPELSQRIAYRHWRNIVAVLLISAYGMLLSFPFQGYGPISIFFSTLSIVGTYYFSILLLMQLSKSGRGTPTLFLRAALFFLMISAAGPFALGPLVAAEKIGTPLYFNCVYFYLHFQYNGWFTFAILAVLYNKLSVPHISNYRRSVFSFFLVGSVLSVFLSFLWSEDTMIFLLAGGLGAGMQLVGLIFLISDLKRKANCIRIYRLEWIALIAFIIKIALQLCNAFPAVAALAYADRPFMIAYLHLIMLGFVTVYILSFVVQTSPPDISSRLRLPISIYVAAFIVSELLLVSQGISLLIGDYLSNAPLLIAAISVAFPVCAFWIYNASLKFKV